MHIPTHWRMVKKAINEFNINPKTMLIASLISISCLLSIKISQSLAFPFSFWAGFTCIRVFSSCRTVFIERSLMRLIATFVACLLVAIVAFQFEKSYALYVTIILLAAFMIFMSSFQRHFAYFYIMFSITILIFLYPTMIGSTESGLWVVIYRSLETLIGTLVMYLLVLPNLKPVKTEFFERQHDYKAPLFKESLFYTLVFVILILIALAIILPFKQVILFEQSIIGIIAVMSAFDELHIKHLSLQRFFGCFAGIIAALVVTSISMPGILLWFISFLILASFALIVQQSKSIDYIGAQASLCYLTVIYADFSGASIFDGFERFISTGITLVSILVVYTLVLAYRAILKKKGML